MSLFDFLRGNKKRRRTGGRDGASTDRHASQKTRHFELPPAPGQHPVPGAAPSPPVENRTIVRPMSQQQANRPQMPPAPVATRSDSAHYPPPQHADAGQTQYIDTTPASTGNIVGVLVATDGELKGQMFRVSDGENRLGRSVDCEIELNSQKISRHHAMLIHHNGIFVIKPLSDRNPTLLNEIQTAGDEVEDGDTIRVGLTTLKFRTI